MSEKIIVDKRCCPVCGRPTVLAKAISETGDPKDAGLWYYCICGIIFNKDFPDPEPKTEEYLKKYRDFKEYELIAKQPVRIYAPIIEELTMGRKMLDIGFGTGKNMEYFKERGWVSFGIEKNKDTKETDRIIKDDFESTDKLYKSTYDLVWMSHVLEKFKDPLSALYKARELLQENGVLYIATPDIDFLYGKPSGEWTHWNKSDNHILWNTRSVKRELERIGFNIVMCRRNYYSRFGFYHDLHLIAQRIYF